MQKVFEGKNKIISVKLYSYFTLFSCSMYRTFSLIPGMCSIIIGTAVKAVDHLHDRCAPKQYARDV